MCTFGIMLSVLRVVATGSTMFLFLNWNLFLAIIPFVVTRFVVYKKAIIDKRLFLVVLVFWLLFFPNSPYILTDLFHLKKSTSMPLWYDLILVLSYAWAALVFGFMSLSDIQKMSATHFGQRITTIGIIVILFVSSFGVYLGRYLRWNSWDIVTNPLRLLGDIGNEIFHPFDHPRTWGVTLVLGCFLNLAYFSLQAIRKENYN
jgi:uncharacterized membrane protein